MAYARQLKNERWQGVYRNAESKKVYTAQYQTKREAKSEGELQQRKVSRGEWVDPDAGKITVQEFAEKHWMPAQTCGEKTKAVYRQMLSYYILPRWGTVQLQSIENPAVKQWVATMAGKNGELLSPATRRKALRLLSSMLAQAVEEDRLPRNKALDKNGKAPKISGDDDSEREHVYLDVRQLRRLASVANEPYRTMILFMGVTGLRPGEALALTVADFDMLRHKVKVMKAYTSIDGKRPTLERTKTKTGRRVVGFDKSLAEPLSRIMQGKGRDALVFPSPEGLPLPQQNLRNRYVAPAVRLASRAVERLQDALEVTPVSGVMDERTETALRRWQASHGLPANGLTTPETWEKLAAETTGINAGQDLRASAPMVLRLGDRDFSDALTPYALRHTAASLMVSRGANIKAVQAVLGHAKASMTLDVYSDLFQDDADAVAERMSDILSDELPLERLMNLGSAVEASGE